MLVPVIIQSDGNNVIFFDAAADQVVAEQLEEEIRLSAPSYSRDYFDESVLFMPNEFVKIVIAFDLHDAPPIAL